MNAPSIAANERKYHGAKVTSCWQLCQFGLIYLSNFPQLKNEMAAKINETSNGFTNHWVGCWLLFLHFLSDSLAYLRNPTKVSGGAHLSCVWPPAGGGINQRPVCFTLLHSSGWRAALFSYLQHAKCTRKTFRSATSPADFWVKAAEVRGKWWKGHRRLLRSCRDCVC